MNETIVTLAEKAAQESALLENETSLEVSVDTETFYIPATFIDKFAELIVKECILTIQMGITRDGHNTEKYLRSMKHIKQIKEHFGV